MRPSVAFSHRYLSMHAKMVYVPSAPTPTRAELPLLAECCSPVELTDPVGLSQPTVSHHLKILVEAGILTRERRGKWAYYQLVPESLNSLATLIASPGS
jgi:DNA-binding transcriptional ArsR family regulator